MHRLIFVGLTLASVVSAAAQQPSELIVRNGVVVTAAGRAGNDLRIRNGTIAEIGPKLAAATGAREIDARGMLVLPGGVDPHVHLGGGPRPGADDYTTGSRAALAGGITTIANFITATPGEDLAATLEKAAALVRAQTIADVLLHVTLNDPAVATAANLAALADRGYAPKIFLSRPQFDQNAAGFLKAVRAAGAAGLLTMLHCEDAAILTATAERMMAEGKSAIRYFAESRPVVAEEVATQRAVAMSEATLAPIYIVHLSSERALRVVESAQARGLPVYVESRILYLHLTKERFEQPDGNIYTGFPPLRERRDVDALWEGIARGSIHVVATDHVSYTREEKMDPSVNIVNARPAGNYLQVNLPLMYSEGVRKGASRWRRWWR
jgi:dihydropyrimidinase